MTGSDRTIAADSLDTIPALLAGRRLHSARLANLGGAVGERDAALLQGSWVARPKGKDRALLLAALSEQGFDIAGSSFDHIDSGGRAIDYRDSDALALLVPSLSFIEVKSTGSERVQPGFRNFFFALTEKELLAAEVLRERYRVVLFNRRTSETLVTSVSEILARSRSRNWQLSVQI